MSPTVSQVQQLIALFGFVIYFPRRRTKQLQKMDLKELCREEGAVMGILHPNSFSPHLPVRGNPKCICHGVSGEGSPPSPGFEMFYTSKTPKSQSYLPFHFYSGHRANAPEGDLDAPTSNSSVFPIILKERGISNAYFMHGQCPYLFAQVRLSL